MVRLAPARPSPLVKSTTLSAVAEFSSKSLPLGRKLASPQLRVSAAVELHGQRAALGGETAATEELNVACRSAGRAAQSAVAFQDGVAAGAGVEDQQAVGGQAAGARIDHAVLNGRDARIRGGPEDQPSGPGLGHAA